jgi:phytoene dehydrogenase-like protein
MEWSIDGVGMGSGPAGLLTAFEPALGGVCVLVLERLAHGCQRTERRSS